MIDRPEALLFVSLTYCMGHWPSLQTRGGMWSVKGVEADILPTLMRSWGSPEMYWSVPLTIVSGSANPSQRKA